MIAQVEINFCAKRNENKYWIVSFVVAPNDQHLISTARLLVSLPTWVEAIISWQCSIRTNKVSSLAIDSDQVSAIQQTVRPMGCQYSACVGRYDFMTSSSYKYRILWDFWMHKNVWISSQNTKCHKRQKKSWTWVKPVVAINLKFVWFFRNVRISRFRKHKMP